MSLHKNCFSCKSIISSYKEYEFDFIEGGYWEGPKEDLIYIKKWFNLKDVIGYYMAIPFQVSDINESNLHSKNSWKEPLKYSKI